jgi:hypothetical protein
VLALERAAQSVGLPVQQASPPRRQVQQPVDVPIVPPLATVLPSKSEAAADPEHHRPFRTESSGSTSSRRAEDDERLRAVLSRIHDVRRQIKSDVGGPPGPAPHLREMQASQAAAADEASSTARRGHGSDGLGDHVRAFYALRDQFFASRDLHRVQRQQHTGADTASSTL